MPSHISKSALESHRKTTILYVVTSFTVGVCGCCWLASSLGDLRSFDWLRCMTFLRTRFLVSLNPYLYPSTELEISLKLPWEWFCAYWALVEMGILIGSYFANEISSAVSTWNSSKLLNPRFIPLCSWTGSKSWRYFDWFLLATKLEADVPTIWFAVVVLFMVAVIGFPPTY